jgi:hypothetical protein
MNRQAWWLLALGAGATVLGGIAVGVRTDQRGTPTATEAGAGSPRLQVDHGVVDLGRVPLGEWVEAHFLLTNAGDARWQLTAVPFVRAVAGC